MNQVMFTKEQVDFIKSNSLIISLTKREKYFHLPFFYKEIEKGVFELIKRKDLPDEVENIINPYSL